MFDKEFYKKQLGLLFPHWSEVEVEKYSDCMESKYLTLKKGPKVVHLEYLGEMIGSSQLSHIESKLACVNLELSSFDKSNVIYNSFEDYQLQSFIAVGYAVLNTVVNSIGSSAAWDAIKYITVYSWRRFVRFKPNSKQRLNFGLKVQTGKNKVLEFKLDGDISEETVLHALDKALDLIRDTKSVKTSQLPIFCKFDLAEDKWITIDVMEAIREKIANRSS